jgi:hypothetical protein
MSDLQLLAEMATKVDAYKSLNEMRLAEQKRVDALKAQEDELKYQILGFLEQHPEVRGVFGTTHKAIIKTSEEPIIEDRAELEKYIVEQDAWDVVSIRLSAPALRDRQEAGEEVPGVGFIDVTKLSITKI